MEVIVHEVDPVKNAVYRHDALTCFSGKAHYLTAFLFKNIRYITAEIHIF